MTTEISISTDERIALVGHLMRRVGAGANRDRLESLSEKSYEELVEDLLNPNRYSDPDVDLLDRYFPQSASPDTGVTWACRWMYNLAQSERPLMDKMALFWHHVFATAWYKAENGPAIVQHIDMFRKVGLGNMRDILLALSKDPNMIFWLDNSESRDGAVNENYGRELLELFSMGIGTYTETDVKMAARAFTGWTFKQPIPLYPYGGYAAEFIYHPEQHDNSEKEFLGEKGNFNGEDIIDIIVKQEACARFISRHLYNFFVADEPQVPAWSITPPQDQQAIDELTSVFLDSDGDLTKVMRALLNANWFKDARYKKIKSPAEFVAGALVLSGLPETPDPMLASLNAATTAMGQQLLNPPTVEGWHTGKEWLDSGTLTERVNFAVNQVAEASLPGVSSILSRIESHGDNLSSEELVNLCLDLTGHVEISGDTHAALVDLASQGGQLQFDTEVNVTESQKQIIRLLQLIVSAPEYQFA